MWTGQTPLLASRQTTEWKREGRETRGAENNYYFMVHRLDGGRGGGRGRDVECV